MDGLPPRYPLASDERSDLSERGFDWRLVIVLLFIRGLVVGFVAVTLFVFAVYLTGGQILWLLVGC
jgi:hypothetical protein